MASNDRLRRPARPDGITAAVIFPLSDASSFVTGAEMVIDAGSTAG